ncbi:MAG: mandelate racemase/muconate lactonizing enzyme family protein [Chloroflexi bacterium]|nr:mandelate racemase/muconate lactonizing enzyme family protein [Chloroflexota bacterium]
MQITEVKTFLVDSGGSKNWLFVKVLTDEGVHGWGEAYTQADRDGSIIAHVEGMARYLVGRSPFAIKHFAHVMLLDYAVRRPAMEFFSALSGIEQALWDVVGKVSGQPVYNLLGGPCRGRVRVYANGWAHHATTPDDYALQAAETVARGFSALKFDPFHDPWRQHVGWREEDHALACVRAVREAVGPEVDILVEAHRRLAPKEAIRIGTRLEALRAFWYEEPVDAENLAGLAEVRSAVRVPIVTGEALYTKNQFAEAFARGAADVVNPDVCNCGGILALKEIAVLAEPHYVAVAPHNYNSMTLGLAATLQVAALMPNFLIAEYFVNFAARSAEISHGLPAVEDGWIRLPTAPGLSIDLDEGALARYPGRLAPARAIRQPWQESEASPAYS